MAMEKGFPAPVVAPPFSKEKFPPPMGMGIEINPQK